MSGPDGQIFDSHPTRHVTSIPIYLDSRIRSPQAGLSSQLYHRTHGLPHGKRVFSFISNDIGSVKCITHTVCRSWRQWRTPA